MRERFAQFSAFITGFSVIELQGTGLIDSYRELLREILGDKLFATFCESSQSVINARIQSEREQQFQKLFVSSEMFWPVVSNLISLWYLGVWNALPDDWYHKQGLPVPLEGSIGSTACPSDSAYVEQLSYRAAFAHPPGAKPTGYGSWSMRPVI